MRQSQEAQPQQRQHKEKPAKANAAAAPSQPKGANAPASGAKKVATRPEHAKQAGQPAQGKPHKEKQHNKKEGKAETPAAAPSGKHVDVHALFAPVGGAAPAAAPPAEALKTIPGLTLDAQQLSFFNSLSAGYGHAYAQQNMPAVQAPVYPHPAMMAQPPMGAPMPMGQYAPQQGARPGVALDAIFQQANAPSSAPSSTHSGAPSGVTVSLDAILPGSGTQK